MSRKSIPPERPPVPAVADATWPRNEIDRFILARLEKAGMKPSPEADKRTLIRRATLDLTALPPTIAEVDAFLAQLFGLLGGGLAADRARGHLLVVDLARLLGEAAADVLGAADHRLGLEDHHQDLR